MGWRGGEERQDRCVTQIRSFRKSRRGIVEGKRRLQIAVLYIHPITSVDRRQSTPRTRSNPGSARSLLL